MGIGRREFLKIFGATIASAAVSPLHAIVLSDDLYINRALGIAFRKPAGWKFLSLKEFSTLKNSQILKDDALSDQLKNADKPLVVITQFDSQEKIIGPSITVYVEQFEYEEGETLRALVPSIEAGYRKVLNDYRHTGNVVEHSISKCESVEFFSEFLYEAENTKAMIRNRTLVTVREPQIYTVNMFDHPGGGFMAQKEYDEFIQSIYFV